MNASASRPSRSASPPRPLMPSRKAWTTAKSKLPAGMTAVVGINIAPIKASALYRAVPPARDGEGRRRARTTSTRSRRPAASTTPASLDSIVVGMQDDDHLVAIVQLKGTTQKDLEACGKKVAKADGKTLTITRRRRDHASTAPIANDLHPAGSSRTSRLSRCITRRPTCDLFLEADHGELARQAQVGRQTDASGLGVARHGAGSRARPARRRCPALTGDVGAQAR